MGVVTSLDCLSGSQSLSFYVFRKSLSVEYHTSREYLPRTMTVGLLVLQTNGHGAGEPILSRVRIINPVITNGYDSCDDLMDDMLNALKYYATTLGILF